MSGKKIQSALISVFDKNGLEPIARSLHQLGVKIYSTGGTQAYLAQLGVPVYAVEDLTGYPSILGGRVKTLHPKVFGGILARRELKSDLAELAQFEIPEFDLVMVDLYPFEKTLASGAGHSDIIEKIDIGGVSLIRAAAKNYADVLVVAHTESYGALAHLLTIGGETDLETRRQFAANAFGVTAHYDSKIAGWLAGTNTERLQVSEWHSTPLRYGENPHQQGRFFGNLDEMFDKLNGKEVSYNNLLDIDAAVQLINEFGKEKACCAILKHNNACGIAIRPTLPEAYLTALACDPLSAFGGVVICNQPVNLPCAQEMHKLFFEVLIAPSFEDQALSLLSSKPNRILLRQKETTLPATLIRSALNGYLWQQRDEASEEVADLKLATTKGCTAAQLNDLVFAARIAKHTRSNTIVLAKDHQLLASGTGQTSRVDALKQAIDKARNFGFALQGAVMASDAFFPFPDCVEIAHGAGINAVVQPGGSVKDQHSIDYCNAHGMAMYFTGRRHFRH